MHSVLDEMPSHTLSELLPQIIRVLPALEAAPPEELRWRPFFSVLSAELWAAVGRGELEVPHQVLQQLAPLMAWLRRNRPPPEAADAARELDQVVRFLEAADAALVTPKAEKAIQLRGLERRVLEVLLQHQGKPLRRGEVQKDIPSHSPSRIYQVLEDLREARLVQRVYGPGRGAEEVAHYLLSDEGNDLCAKLGVGEAEETPKAANVGFEKLFGKDSARYAESMPQRNLMQAWGRK